MKQAEIMQLYVLNNNSNVVLTEAAASDVNGKMHEILTGYHLNGGKHMSPAAAEHYHALTSGMSQDSLDEHHQRAKKTAEAIHKHLKASGETLSKVHHTSKEGDIEKHTGVAESQHENPSDLVVRTKSGKHIGVSLKTTSKKNAIVPSANPGRSRLDRELGVNSDKHLSDAHKAIEKSHPSLKGLSMSEKKEQSKHDEGMKQDAAKHVNNALVKTAHDYTKAINKMNPKERIEHFKSHAHLHDTKVDHIKVTAHGSGEDTGVRVEHPGSIGASIKSVKAEHHGNSVVYHVTHHDGSNSKYHLRLKPSSSPFSSIKGSVEQKSTSSKKKIAESFTQYMSGKS